MAPCGARLIPKILINLRAWSALGGRRGVQKVRVAEFAVRSYLALLAAGYVVLCSALLTLAFR
jgi:hypothetical protein